MASTSYLPDDRPKLSQYLDKQRINADPVGPPTPSVAPGPSQAPAFTGGKPLVAVNPTATEAAQDPGFLRPTSGNYSPSNLDPNNPPRPAPTLATAIAPAPTSTTPAPPASAPIAAAATPTTTTPNAVASPAASGGAGTDVANARPIPGAIVNGVRVFSDGSGGANAPAATLDKTALTDVAQGRSLSRADAGVGGNIASEALGTTPVLGSAEGLALSRARPQPNVAARAQADVARAAQDQVSDLASIANRDPRSVLGTAARNAAVERESRGPGGEKAYQDSLTALNSGATASLKPTADIASEQVRQAGETQRNATTAAATIEAERLRKPGGQQVNLADGTLGLIGSDGVVRPAVDTNGRPIRPQVGKPALDTAAYGKSLQANVDKLLGVDPVSGQIPDPANPGKTRAPTAAELYRASVQARKLTNEQYGVGEGPGSLPDKPTPNARGGADDERKPPPPEEGEVRQDANGNRARWANGQWVPV